MSGDVLQMRPVTVVAPETVRVVVSCPRCDQTATVAVRLNSRATFDDDGTGTLSLRSKAPKVPHVCGQQQLDLP